MEIFANPWLVGIGTAIVSGLVLYFVFGIGRTKPQHEQTEPSTSPNSVVFKTTEISPNPEKEIYDHCVLPGGELIPIANPVLKEEKPKQGAGPWYNITFTVSNNSDKELLVDRIEAHLIKYQELPEKYILTRGPHAVLRPIYLYLKLDPSQDTYELLDRRYLSIAGGKTEHTFSVWVCGNEPGIYRFKIMLVGRIGGCEERITPSDILYSFAIPPKGNNIVCFFTYREKVPNDPNFKEILQILDKPTAEFRSITSSWGKYKLMQSSNTTRRNSRDVWGK